MLVPHSPRLPFCKVLFYFSLSFHSLVKKQQARCIVLMNKLKKCFHPLHSPVTFLRSLECFICFLFHLSSLRQRTASCSLITKYLIKEFLEENKVTQAISGILREFLENSFVTGECFKKRSRTCCIVYLDSGVHKLKL